MYPIFVLSALVYVSGVALYSALFVFSANQDPLFQTAKILVAALHSLVLIVPVYLAQTRLLVVRLLGYAVLALYFLYAVFVVGFFPYFGFIPDFQTYGTENAIDLFEVAYHYFYQFFGARELVLVGTGASLFYLTPRQRLPVRGLSVLALPFALLMTSLVFFGTPGESRKFGNETVIRRFGLATFSYASILDGLGQAEGTLAAKTSFPGRIADLVSPDQGFSDPIVAIPSGLARVIMVQIESFDTEAVDAKLSGIDVMPFVFRLKEQ